MNYNDKSAPVSNSVVAAHRATEPRSAWAIVLRTDTYANVAGDLRVDERGFDSSVSTLTEGTTSTTTVKHDLDEFEKPMWFQSKRLAIVVLNGETCRRMIAASAILTGLYLSGMNSNCANIEITGAMIKANSSIAESVATAITNSITTKPQRQPKQFTSFTRTVLRRTCFDSEYTLVDADTQ